ncbi:MAG TPA: DUF58 domain-containing protein [Pyrinomonadaceae bacterium]|jgi:uncharacterized protein (DUF58 family)|nr:DUF58 domain-containing protein [Pyrinomonadaceae bacterium]
MLRAWWRTILGTLLVVGGLATAVLTWLARRTNDWQLTRWGAILSLVFIALISIFVVPPLVKRVGRESRAFDPPLRLTSGGVVFCGIFLVVGLAAYNTGNNLLFLVFSVLASTLFVSWAAARSQLRDLSVSARFPDHIFAGEPAPVLVGLRNSKRVLPSFSVLVEWRHQLEGEPRRKILRRLARRPRFDKQPLAYFTHVPRRSRAEQRVEQTFPRRGHVLVTGFELSTRFPFGFFRLRRRLRARNVDLVIYPKLEPASDELHLLPMNIGRHISARRGAGHDLHSLREYLPQDDVRHIDWKATARARHLVVREFTSEDERRVHVVLDTRPRGEEGDAVKASARFERGVTLAASLVAHFIEERAEVRLTLGPEPGGYGSGQEHLYATLRRLALVAPEDGARTRAAAVPPAQDFWESIARASAGTDANYVILLTSAAPGTIPAHVWRQSHVIYL